ncbi:N-acetylglucosamine-6-phosphate deacetylase [Lachnospiraceae bacterium PF1-22]|uniref:N-acetylglucosamine-6-phosphate deacetylase n=1 Tax=Ohessyouella blattaphilus TaxID=2949333 RepID=UPI003E2DAB6B
MIIKNVKVYGKDQVFRQGEVIIRDGLFQKEALPGEEEIDGKGCYAIPGLIDMHFHGCMGSDVCDNDQEGLQKIADYEASVGVTSMCPATMTLPLAELGDVVESIADFKSEKGAKFVGINMEGPFISKVKKGAQDDSNIIPANVEVFREFQKRAKGLVKFIGVAPEVESEVALDFIKEVKDEVSVSLAHTNASYEEAERAFTAGAKTVTHLFNAMSPFGHRDPGVVGAAFDHPEVFVELISDGIHLHPSMVRVAFQLFGTKRICLISDSMRATGLVNGIYTLGGQEVNVHDGKATMVKDGAIAGSVHNLLECLRYTVNEVGIPLEEALACATINPARALKLEDRYGSIEAGKVGNLVLLNEKLQVEKVLING